MKTTKKCKINNNSILDILDNKIPSDSLETFTKTIQKLKSYSLNISEQEDALIKLKTYCYNNINILDRDVLIGYILENPNFNLNEISKYLQKKVAIINNNNNNNNNNNINNNHHKPDAIENESEILSLIKELIISDNLKKYNNTNKKCYIISNYKSFIKSLINKKIDFKHIENIDLNNFNSISQSKLFDLKNIEINLEFVRSKVFNMFYTKYSKLVYKTLESIENELIKDIEKNFKSNSNILILNILFNDILIYLDCNSELNYCLNYYISSTSSSKNNINFDIKDYSKYYISQDELSLIENQYINYVDTICKYYKEVLHCDKINIVELLNINNKYNMINMLLFVEVEIINGIINTYFNFEKYINKILDDLNQFFFNKFNNKLYINNNNKKDLESIISTYNICCSKSIEDLINTFFKQSKLNLINKICI